MVTLCGDNGGTPMVYLTGDTHGDFSRIAEFCFEYGTTTEDTMIILGDAGINYHLSEADQYLKEELAQLPLTLLIIHGNHEERPENIQTYLDKNWQGGTVYFEEEYPNILFASDGEIYDLDGAKAIAIGGAYSVDKYYRLRQGLAWFESEQPDGYIKSFVESQLEQVNWRIDFVLSHTCPEKFIPFESFLPNIDDSSVDRSTEEWLDEIEKKLDYDRWFFGHFHTEKNMGQFSCLYENFECLDDF